MEHSPNAQTAALAGIPARRVAVWRCRGQEPGPRSGDQWQKFSPLHALLLNIAGNFVDEHAASPADAADIAERAAPELLRQWHRLPSGLAVVLTARPSGKEHSRYALDVLVTTPPVAVRLGTDVVASFSVNATAALREMQERAEAAGVALPPLSDRDGWCRAMK